MNKAYWIIILLLVTNLSFAQEIKDKTKYYVSDIENFNNYSARRWSLLDKSQLKIIAKALSIKTDEAEKIIESTNYRNHPTNKLNTDVAYIMYKVGELIGYSDGGFKYTSSNDILYLMYVPNELNTHLPPDKLAANGKGFFQVTNKLSVSTTPLSNEYYKPSISLKNENYSFGFRFGPKNSDSLVVLKVIKSSPAEKAGIKTNDVIIEFNGQNIKNKTRLEAAQIFKESAFTNNSFKVLRNNSIQTITIDKVNVKTIEFVCISSDCDNGECIIENINGYTIKGNCKDGNIIGNAKFIAEDGFEFYEGSVEKRNNSFNKYNYVTNGFGKEKFRNGDSFEGNYVNGKKEGNGIYTYANGTQKKGIWKADKYFDDISIGFANERFRVENNRVYLHHLKLDFKSKMVEITNDEKQRIGKMYNISDADLDKLFALCDMKYKPVHLNTPQKIRAIIDKNEKQYPYEAYRVVHFYGIDEEVYNIIYLPTAYNIWLPEGVKFDVQDGLYFCVPAALTSGINYYSYENNLAILKGIEEDKIREKEQQLLAEEHAEWASKNKWKGAVIIQYKNEDATEVSNKYKYNAITIFGPPDREVDDIDLNDLLDKYEFYYKKFGFEYIGIKFHKNMDESGAEDLANALTNTHRYSVNTNFNYTLPERKAKSTGPSYAELKAASDAAYKEAQEASKVIIEDKTYEKSEMRQKAVTDIFAGKDIIEEATQVQVVGISTSDKYYTQNQKFIGKTGTVEATLIDNGDGTYYGTIQFPNEKYSTIFYNVKIKIIK